MQELLLQMLESAKKDKSSFLALKKTVVKCQQFELAAKMRELELELFPPTQEEKSAKDLATEIQNVLGMVRLNVSPDTCWLIHETLKVHSKMGGEFSIKEAAELVVKKKELFDED